MSATNGSAPSRYPEPLVVPPLRPPHRQTLILLHGRGSEAAIFGPALLDHPVEYPDASRPLTTLRDLFPRAKFVFPTARRSRAKLYKRAFTHQWFDSWDHAEPRRFEELQIPGLRESGAFVRRLIRDAVEEVGAGNVVLGGLSQGCAAGLIALLTAAPSEVQGVAGFMGLCGYLPFCARMREEVVRSHGVAGAEAAAEDDPFDRGPDEESVAAQNPGARAIQWLNDELDIDAGPCLEEFQRIPLFLGHGDRDEKVSVEEGRDARDLLREISAARVTWNEYEGLEHWYSKEMIGDVARFLGAIGWEVAKPDA